jgi:ATP-dependent Lon protease
MQLDCEDLSEDIIYTIESGISSCDTEEQLLDIFSEAMKNFREAGKIKTYAYERCEIADTYKTITFTYQPNIDEYIKQNNSIRKIILVRSEKNKGVSVKEMLKGIKSEIGEKQDKNKPYKEFSDEIDKMLEGL